ncbi:MAG: type II secretion system protein [Gemmatimonadetes bacterium]|nr:type II secretion system protein [Gemmatimonadota bacterium]
MNRRGFTLTELLVALTVMSVAGIALIRLLTATTRFVSLHDTMLSARHGARAALNTMVAELGVVGDSGLTAATADGKSITVRPPYAFGVTCRHASSQSFVGSLMPADSVMYASAVVGGFFWRRLTSKYAHVPGPITVAPSDDAAKCDADSVRIVPGGTRVVVSGYPASFFPESLAVFMLYQVVTYRFGDSATLPGRIGLWRQAGGNADEELVAPFDGAAGFGFLVGGPNAATLTVENAPPADLNRVRGLELRLFGQSEVPAQGSTAPQVFRLKTRVMFSNKTY